MNSIKRMVAIILIVMMTMSGCSVISGGGQYAADFINMKSDSSVMESQYMAIYNLVDSRRDSFTEDELAELEDINFAFTTTAERIKDMMANPEKIVTPNQLKSMYELAYIGYTNAREIIARHKADFTSYQWDKMANFDEQAIEYDKSVRKVLDNPDTDDINMTLGVIVTLSGAAYKYLLPVIVSMI